MTKRRTFLASGEYTKGTPHLVKGPCHSIKQAIKLDCSDSTGMTYSSLETLIQIVPFDASTHLEDLILILSRVREKDPTYPPAEVEASREGFIEWFYGGDALARWVVIVNGQVIGHRAVFNPPAYLTSNLVRLGYPSPDNVLEIGKFFIDPTFRVKGSAAALWDVAESFIHSLGKIPSNVVVSTSVRALEITRKLPWVNEVGSFTGVHGLNHIFVYQQTV